MAGLFGLLGKDRSTVVNGAVATVKKVFDLVDKRKHTAQEQAEIAFKRADGAAEFMKATLSESTERSITRRWIAIFYIIFFCIFILCIGVAWKFDPEWAEFLLKLLLSVKLEWAFITIIVFFFGGYVLKEHILKSKK